MSELVPALQRVIDTLRQVEDSTITGLLLAFQSGRDRSSDGEVAAAFGAFHDVVAAEWERRANVGLLGAEDAETVVIDLDEPPADDGSGTSVLSYRVVPEARRLRGHGARRARGDAAPAPSWRILLALLLPCTPAVAAGLALAAAAWRIP